MKGYLAVVENACHLSTEEEEARISGIQGHLGYIVSSRLCETLFLKKKNCFSIKKIKQLRIGQEVTEPTSFNISLTFFGTQRLCPPVTTFPNAQGQQTPALTSQMVVESPQDASLCSEWPDPKSPP